MITRRFFMTCGVALAAAAAAWPARRSATAPTSTDAGDRAPLGSRRRGPGTVIALVDRLLDGSGSFAAYARAGGLRVHEFASDAGGVWMTELEPRLRLGAVAIEGYTSAATLFCLELLARDYGARVVRRGAGAAGVTWLLSSNPMQRAPLAPRRSQERSAAHA
jgi:hypothetical protein